ncbi:unnamed protein product [Lactuca virosa]|uniref:Uncharacterized protein n=1 Tax=Lactuca virosa TaxID=75947 RepID=A0AAU9NT98_9ASTR|nr:unnamed protein product [Lactuca virosa]
MHLEGQTRRNSLLDLNHTMVQLSYPLVFLVFEHCIRNLICLLRFFFLRTDCETEEQFSTRLATSLENLILKEGPETIAAFIAEPVMGAEGVTPPPEGYFEVLV